MTIQARDEHWMQQAIELAKLGLGKTSPNPSVGCVIVSRDNELLGNYYHQKYGGDHAEKGAIKSIIKTHGAQALKSSTCYVTLEPCSSHGQTGACTSWIIDHQISTVVYGCVDPNTKHAGRADKILNQAGITVRSGVLKLACERLIQAFKKSQCQQIPWLATKLAISLDGKLDRPSGESPWISCPESRQRVQLLRAQFDAILTSTTTLAADKPQLTLRDSVLIEQGYTQPKRLVFTRQKPEKINKDHQPLFNDEYANHTYIYQIGSNKYPDFQSALKHCYKEYGIQSILVEAGAKLNAALIEESLIDEWIGFYAPIIAGGPTSALSTLTRSNQLHQVSRELIGTDILIRGLLHCSTCS